MFIQPPKVIKYIDGIHAKYKPNYKTTGTLKFTAIRPTAYTERLVQYEIFK